MLENGFEHRQYSGYKSIQTMDKFEIYDIVKKLHNTYNWLKPCVKKFDVTDIGEQYDLTFVFEDKTLQNEKAPTKENLQKDSAKEQLRQQVKEISQKLKNDKNTFKDKGIER